VVVLPEAECRGKCKEGVCEKCQVDLLSFYSVVLPDYVDPESLSSSSSSSLQSKSCPWPQMLAMPMCLCAMSI